MENETRIIEKNDVPAQPAPAKQVEPVQETKPKLEIGKAKIEPKPEIKPEPKQETKPKPEAKTEQKTEAKQEPEIKKEEIKPKKQYTKEIHINVLEDKRCYRKKDIIPEEIKYRLKHGYHESEQWDIETGKSETYLLKPRSNESDSHLFLIYRIADFLFKHTSKVWLFETYKPDIIFEASDGKKVAIEVETGQVYKFKKKELLQKVKRLNQEFDDWFFVVTNKEYFKKYLKLGKTYTRSQILGVVQFYLKKPETSSVCPPPKMPKQGLSLHKTEVLDRESS